MILEKLLTYGDDSIITGTDLYETNIDKYANCPEVICEIVKREMRRFGDEQRSYTSYSLCYLDVYSLDYDYDLHTVITSLANNGFIDLGGFVVRYDSDGYYGVLTGARKFCFDKDLKDCLYRAIELGLEECDISMAEIDYSIPEIIESIVRIQCPDTFKTRRNYMNRIIGIKKHGLAENIECEVEQNVEREVEQNVELKINQEIKEAKGGAMDIFGLKFGSIGNTFNVQMDRDGNLGIDGRYVDSGDVLAELGTLVDDGCVKLIVIPTEIDKIKTGDLFLYDGEALIVKKVDSETGSIDYYKGENVMRKALKMHPMLRKIMVSKVVNLYSMFNDISELLPLMVYGENRVIDLITQQIVSGRKINLDEIEYQLNPVKAQTDLNRILAKVLELKI